MEGNKRSITQEEWLRFTKEQRLDYIISNELFAQYGDRLTRNELLEYIKRNVAHGNCKCPVCGRGVGAQHKSLDSGELRFAVVLYNMTFAALTEIDVKSKGYDNDLLLENLPSFHYKKVLDTCKEKHGTYPTGFPVLKHWGLIEKDNDKRSPLILGRGKTNSYWYLTRRGYDFIHSKMKLPKECSILNDEVISWSKEEVLFWQCGTIPWEERQQYRTTYF